MAPPMANGTVINMIPPLANGTFTPPMANATFIHPKVCIFFSKNMRYNGVFVSGNPLDYIYPVFLLQVILCVTFSKAIHALLRPLKQSKLVCNILAGIILGPSVLGRSNSYMKDIFAPKEMVVLGTMSNMGSTLFLFLVYIKADTDMFFRNVKKTWKISLSCIMVPFLFTLVLTSSLSQLNFLPGFKPGLSFAIQFSVISSLSYFIVIAHALDELNLLCSEIGQLSTSITMLNEVVSCVLVLIGVAARQNNKPDMFYAVFSLCALIAFAIFIIRPVLLWIVDTTPKGKPVNECYVIAVVVCTLLMGVTTDAAGATFGPAAVIMGFVVPDGPPLGATIIEKCELIITEFFLPLFFVRIGYFTDLSAIQDWKELVVFAAVIVVGYIGRLLGSVLVSSSFNMSNASAILLSLILSLQGIVELMHGIKWKHEKVLDNQNFATLVMSIVILNAIITPIIQTFYNPESENYDLPKTVKNQRCRSLGMSSSIGELRIITCLQDEENVPNIINLLKALNSKEMCPICAYVVHLVPLATQTVPTLDPYKNHNRMFRKPNDSDNIMRAFLNYAEGSPSVQIQPFRMISPYKYMHQPICRLAESTRTPLIIVPFFKSQEVHGSDGTLRILNTSIQAFARCTVGILVDRGLRKRISSTSFSYNVAVIFLGGADDREALAFATRMSGHPNIAITVLRLHLRGINTWESDSERMLDESLFREFKAMNENNACVVCREIVVHDSEEVMNALLSIPSNYDLVVVGKRQGIPHFEDRLISWTQYRELGVIGDAIASPDFFDGMMSILVVQHHGDGDLKMATTFSYFTC